LRLVELPRPSLILQLHLRLMLMKPMMMMMQMLLQEKLLLLLLLMMTTEQLLQAPRLLRLTPSLQLQRDVS
jgi:hypothetical protein